MRINDYNPTSASSAEATRAAETQETERASNVSLTGARTDGDRVEFSSTLSGLSRALAAFGSQRAATVESLTGEYRAGRYQPDAVATGRALISEALAPAGG